MIMARLSPKFYTLLLLHITANAAVINSPPLETVKEWTVAMYNFEFNAPTTDKTFYAPENIVTTGIAVGMNRIYIATPRLFSGVPATVSSIPRGQYDNSPVLEAYPDWSFHAAGRLNYNCSDLGLVSVYRLRIDSCNRLWALDAGISRSLEDYEVTCPPKILVFDLNTNNVVRRIDFPREVRRGESLYTNLIIDETTSRPENNCDDAFIYITDTVEPAIIVYDSGRDLTWRLSHPSMFPDPNFAQSEILGDRFTLMDGIVGLAFDAKAGVVYFQPFATDRLFSISTAVLRAGPPPANTELAVRLVGKKSSQGIGLAISPVDGTIYFAPMTETAIAQWNPNTNRQRILACDEQQLQFVADLATSRSDPGALYALSSKFQRFFLKTLNKNEINTRIMRLEAYGPGAVGQSQFTPFQFTPAMTRPVGYTPALTRPTTSMNKPYFSGIRQPFRYEPVGIINRPNKNPFTALNFGELPMPVRRPALTLAPSTYTFPKPNPTYQDFNTLRLTKSISRNATGNY